MFGEPGSCSFKGLYYLWKKCFRRQLLFENIIIRWFVSDNVWDFHRSHIPKNSLDLSGALFLSKTLCVCLFICEVCIPTVILAPGACGRWAPSCRSWHHFGRSHRFRQFWRFRSCVPKLTQILPCSKSSPGGAPEKPGRDWGQPAGALGGLWEILGLII